jgi:hypothetical protein
MTKFLLSSGSLDYSRVGTRNGLLLGSGFVSRAWPSIDAAVDLLRFAAGAVLMADAATAGDRGGAAACCRRVRDKFSSDVVTCLLF